MTEAPQHQKKLVALYDDGSGAMVFYAYDGGFIDGEGEAYEVKWLSESFSLWAYLPDSFQLNCERWVDDPYVLTVAGAQRSELSPTPAKTGD